MVSLCISDGELGGVGAGGGGTQRTVSGGH